LASAVIIGLNMAIDLPTVRFDKPPVTEVALGIAFEPLQRLHPVHLGAWWQTIRDPYVNVEQQPAIPPQLDSFPGDAEQSSGTRGMLTPFPFGEQFPRHWFVTADKRRILQIQRDRFVANWRKIGPDDTYPEYHNALRPEFESRWRQFCEFLHSQQLGEAKVLQCEVTYVNSLKQGREWNSFNEIDRVVSPWCGSFSEEIPPLEAAVIHTGFLIPETTGRVQLTFQPAVDPNGQNILQINVVGKVRPGNSEPSEVLRWMDLSHDWAVHAFTAFTTGEMHKLWQRRD
jgi:uncharacterized protein (TIGR04255 family)